MDLSKTLSYFDVYDEEIKRHLEDEFSKFKDECYLDHSGATLYSDSQIKEVSQNLQTTIYANPHSAGVFSAFTYDTIESIRYRILEHFHTTSDEYTVIFTSGATASLKVVAETFKFGQKNSHFVYTQDSHTSVLGMRELICQESTKITCLPYDQLSDIFDQPYKMSEDEEDCKDNNSLFVYSAQCNFSGLKLPLEWIQEVHNGALHKITEQKHCKWYVLLDAAAFCATNDLNLSVFKPDFVCLSFYKMFGYPTGIGTLLVRNRSANILEKKYYGGGTVNISMSSKMFHVKRSNLSERFEDGTIPFLSIASLLPGLKILSGLSMNRISRHVFSLARHLHHSLMVMHHHNGQPLVELYSDTDYEDRSRQGGVVTFNILRSNGQYVGYMEVLNMAAIYKIHLRTGCFCNPGACQRHLKLSNEDLLENYDAGYICGGTKDLVNGRPTGAVRISFGYMSTIKHVETVLTMVKNCFLDGPEVVQLPSWWESSGGKKHLNEKFYSNHTLTVKSNNVVKTDNRRGNIKCIENSTKLEEHLLHNILKNENLLNKKSETPIIEQKNSYKESYLFNLSPKISNMKVKSLFIYPIKSCGFFEIKDSWIIGSKGLKYDREWMVVTSFGVCLTQKQEVNLCLIRPQICFEKRELILSYPGMPDCSIPLDEDENRDEDTQGRLCQGKICGHKVEGVDCGINVSEWLSLALGRPKLRLVRQSKSTNEVKECDKPELSFVSQAQYLLLNAESIFWLANKVANKTDFDVSTIMYRFRGNIIVTGCDPFDEQSWECVKIGNCEFKVDGPCTRCQMICIDQTTGKKTVEPLKTLTSEFSGRMRFGIYLRRMFNTEDVLRIGDKVEIS